MLCYVMFFFFFFPPFGIRTRLTLVIILVRKSCILGCFCVDDNMLEMLILLVFTICILLCHFFGTLRCVGVQFVSGAPLVCCCKASCCIGSCILALFILVPISKHLVASI